MPQRKLKADWDSVDQPGLPAGMETAIAAPSPARMLQQLLEERNAQFPEPHVDKWSQRRALTFIVTSAAALWMALLVAGAEAAKAIV